MKKFSRVFLQAYLNSHYQTGLKNLLDVVEHANDEIKNTAIKFKKVR